MTDFWSSFFVFADVTEKSSISPTKRPQIHAADPPKLRLHSSVPKPDRQLRSNGTKQDKSSARADMLRADKPNGRANPSNSRAGRSKLRSNLTMNSYSPISDRGVELTFAESGNGTVFMMVRGNAFIQLDGEAIPTFQLRLVYVLVPTCFLFLVNRCSF